MQERPGRPTDIRAKPPRVSICRGSGQEVDSTATKALLDSCTQDDGFHCPKCKEVFTNPDIFIEHLAEEINQALLNLP
ncbi:hypothetical protein ES708_15753 [subsurface metagenome]